MVSYADISYKISFSESVQKQYIFNLLVLYIVHRKKKVREFPVPSRDPGMSLPNSPWAGKMTS